MPTKLIEANGRKREPKSFSKLTEMQRAFCECLAGDPQFNPTNAARAAGYSEKGISVTANKLMNRQEVQDYLGWVLQQRRERRQLIADDVLEQLRNALFLDPLELFESSGNGAFVVKSLDQVPEHIRRCITKLKCKSVETEDGVETYLEVELMSKDAAMVNALKHLGLVRNDGTAVNVNIAGGVDTAALLEQVEQERGIIDGDVIEQTAKESS